MPETKQMSPHHSPLPAAAQANIVTCYLFTRKASPGILYRALHNLYIEENFGCNSSNSFLTLIACTNKELWFVPVWAISCMDEIPFAAFAEGTQLL